MSTTITIGDKEYTLRFEENPSLDRVEEATDLFCQEMSKDTLGVFLTWGDQNLFRPMTGANGLCDSSRVRALGNKLYETNPPEEMNSKYFMDYQTQLPQEAGPVIGKTMAEASAHIDQVTKIPNAEKETYWCMLAVVSKPYQQHGIGTALFQLAFAKAKEAKLDLALATTWDKNLVYYTRPQLGFTVAGHTQMAADTKYPWDNYVLLRKYEEL
ncbi:hypothetical protein BU15DRAFT_73967 [Melanogaster broomeanus]|nr:hypothetical protein BU15DRAFT_73967 [Melanogaster broomeanus]